MAAVLVVVVVALAYGSAAPTLAVAEFSPAGRQVEIPPSTANPDAGRDGGGRGSRGRATTTTTAAPSSTEAGPSSQAAAPTTRVGRARTCVGNPPRQIDDPQSPPCVPFVFEGDNGGATWRGVSATEIRVAVDNGYDDRDGALQALFDYFNLHFEFYGRRLVPIVMPYNVQEAVQQRATAADIAAKGAFAATGRYPNHTLPILPLHQALAREQIVSLNGQEYPYGEDSLLAPFHPYIWTVNQSSEEIWTATSELICTALAGRPAAHAGTELATTMRKFGVITATNVTATIPMPTQPRTLLDRLDACGVEPVTATVNGSGGSVDYRLAIEKFKAAGVTTVICSCYSGINYVISASTPLGYVPEILLPSLGWPAEIVETDMQAANRVAYAPHVFGVYPTPRLLPYQVRPVFTAIRSMMPAYDWKSGGQQYWRLEKLYRELLVLASGVQGAGPYLTPDSFGQALMTMQFPNPGVGQAPYWQGGAGFGPGDHSMADDVALAWWNPAIPGSSVQGTNAAGSWCFLGGGTRYSPGQIPADADSRFFNPAEPCR